MNPSQRNNNPLNLEFANQTESIGSDGRFAKFPDGPSGWRAAHVQIREDQNRGLTLREFAFKFAPPNENNTNAYLDFMIDQLKSVNRDSPLRMVSVYALAGIMAQYEGYYNKD